MSYEDDSSYFSNEDINGTKTKEVDDTFFNEHLMDDVAEDVSESPAIHFDRKSPHATEDERKPPPASSFDGRNPDETSLKDYTTSVLQGRQFVITSRRISESTISMTMLYFYQSIFTKDITTSGDVVDGNGLYFAPPSAPHSVLQGRQFVITSRSMSKTTILVTMSYFH